MGQNRGNQHGNLSFSQPRKPWKLGWKHAAGNYRFPCVPQCVPARMMSALKADKVVPRNGRNRGYRSGYRAHNSSFGIHGLQIAKVCATSAHDGVESLSVFNLASAAHEVLQRVLSDDRLAFLCPRARRFLPRLPALYRGGLRGLLFGCPASSPHSVANSLFVMLMNSQRRSSPSRKPTFSSRS